ncbi:MAG: hypothetical protein IID09_02540 [Candidatus Hydrogenedentes bacterium]|nr:hypothetical protein [Candidatus Hydrogenedentota bacterium]
MSIHGARRDFHDPLNYTHRAMEPIPDRYRYQAGQLEALRALVGSSPRSFSLNLAICSDSSLRSLLVQQLQAGFPAIEVVSFWPYTIDLFEHVHAAMSTAPKDALFVFGLEDALNADIDHAALLALLNSSPSRWKAWFACPVVFWVNEQTAGRLRDDAKDFWEWQSDLFRIDA